MKNYGVLFKGGKNKIALEIVAQMPPAEYFVDLFCGGGAVTQAAKESGKYKYFIINDILPGLTDFVKLAMTSGIEFRKEYCTRKEFQETKGKDWYNTILYSFGYNCRDYLYSYQNEQEHKDLFNLIVNSDYDSWKKYEYGIPENFEKLLNIEERRNVMHFFLSKTVKLPEKLSRVDNLTRFNRLKELKGLFLIDEIRSNNLFYDEVDIPKDSVIYCDIPYQGTDGYQLMSKKNSFDYDKFYKWAYQQENIYISEYSMPNNFKYIWEKEKITTLCATQNNIKIVEKLFIPNK